MKKLNITNKIYVVILLAMIIATAVKFFSYSGWSRYYYGASVSAPRSYPAHVRNAFFILKDGDTKPIATSDVNDNRGNWGYGDYQSPRNPDQLPEKLVLEYTSYRDGLFYADTISLPLQAIKDAFKAVDKKGINTEQYQAPTVKRFDFVIGIANKGNIIVWLQGEHNETTLLKYKITPHEPVGDQTYYNGRLPKEQYLQEVFHIDSALKADIAKGVDRDANYIDTPSLFKLRIQQQ
ncbi:MAG: DUF2931 family protein [Mucilaginibacter sp.]|jgi:hypothetical protein|uniref:DUF2931 family protein n=1 Tax=Mucilaginibacter sp. TaxID=1882438 RepID=UPI0035619514